MNAVFEEREETGMAVNPFEGQVVARPSGALIEAEQQRAVAEVQAQLIIARSNPRDVKKAVDLILQDCTRLGLAEKSQYAYAKGGTDIYGSSIRLAETMARRWGNIECGVKELSRGAGFSDCISYAWDLETNYRESKTFRVKHWRDTKGGGYPIKEEREIYELIANQGARRKRACILAIIPGDVEEAARKQCDLTLKAKAEVTTERLASLVEHFEEFGVTKAQIEKRIQRHMEVMTPALLLQLGKIYNSLKDGMSTAAEWFEPEAGPQAAAPANDAAPATGVDKAKADIRKKRENREVTE